MLCFRGTCADSSLALFHPPLIPPFFFLYSVSQFRNRTKPSLFFSAKHDCALDGRSPIFLSIIVPSFCSFFNPELFRPSARDRYFFARWSGLFFLYLARVSESGSSPLSIVPVFFPRSLGIPPGSSSSLSYSRNLLVPRRGVAELIVPVCHAPQSLISPAFGADAKRLRGQMRFPHRQVARPSSASFSQVQAATPRVSRSFFLFDGPFFFLSCTSETCF